MRENRIHRVIIEDTKSSTFTGFITYETIFEYFLSNYYSDMICFHLNIQNTNIMTTNIIWVDKNETIYNCLLKFWTHRISILPVFDKDTNSYFGFFYLKDIVYFFANGEKFSVSIYFYYFFSHFKIIVF
jgi:CBS domain-containing protein